jgi:nucleotide-binding universal stress UspA family protein
MTYVVGFSRRRGERAVLDLAAQLARSDGEDLLVVTVVPRAWPTAVAGHTDREFEQWASSEGESGAEQALALLADGNSDVPARAIWVSGRSVPRVLMDQAERAGAGLIAVGSGTDGSYGHIVTSSTTNRLLHSSTVPVAIATRGYRSAGQRIARVTCAFRGDDASRATLHRTAEICARVGAQLRIVTFGVRGRRMYPPEISGAEQMVLDTWVEQANKAQAEAVEELKSAGALPPDVESVVAVGRIWSDALDDIGWGRGDVLVIGSSRGSLVEQVFLGSSAAKILRSSPVPVLVVP